MTTTATPTKTGYAPVNGLQMYYEIHGEGGTPLVLLHGAFSAIPTSFGPLLPGLSASRQVIGTELQAHGRTADIDRPLRVEQLADDVVGLLDHLGVAQADVLGYSTGAFVALHLAVRHPERVRRMVLISASYKKDGVHPGLWDGLTEMRPEMMHGSPFHDEYVALAPDPDHFPVLFEKKQEMDANLIDFTPDEISNLRPPVLLIIGDSDLITPEHSVEFFRLLGGGVFGDMVAMPDSQLAVIPGASHITVVQHVTQLTTIIPRFLDAE